MLLYQIYDKTKINFYGVIHGTNLANRDTLHDPVYILPSPYLYSSHIICCEGDTSGVLCHNICYKWYKSNMDSRNFQRITTLFKNQQHFSTFYTAILHHELKARLVWHHRKPLLQNIRNQKSSYLVISHQLFCYTWLILRTSFPKLILKRICSFLLTISM